MAPLIAKTIAAATVVFLILLAQRHDNSAVVTAVATLPYGTTIALVALASAEPAKAQTFAANAVLALPLWRPSRSPRSS